ncbi:phage baseplate assembly protein V [Photobacterium salinisoli]|uniref:phage baseplate assembly protein V n=1 Tax=Photobacterium salinisoli TaxID=1616783 RepID=UPI000EA11751|nr:phage baseplate assembly protein V [Photobacterium salinisoli]
MGMTESQFVRLLSEMIQFGTIIAIQAKPLRYKVRFDANRTSGWLRSNVGHAAEVKDWHPMQQGEQVIVLKPFGAQGGVIIGSLNQAQFDQPKDNLKLFYREFPDGTWLQYDMENHVLSGEVSGSVELKAEQAFKVESPKIVLVGDIEHQGMQTTTGNISSGASISAATNISDSVRSMADDRKIFNQHEHPHGVPNTQKPIQQQ